MSGPEAPVGGDPKVTLDGSDDWRFTRRTFIKGAALTAGAAAAVGALGSEQLLGALEPAEGAPAPAPETLVRTGHSNNCDGACGHLVHVADGKVKLVEGAMYDATTIAGTPIPQAYPPRICLRGVSQQENLYGGNRIKYPYKRVGDRGSGKWQRISWDEATTLIADNLTKVQQKYGKDSVWIAPYTGSLSLLEGVVGVGFRFASVIGAVAGDFEGDNEGDSSTPAGWNYVLVDPANPSNGGGFFDGHESTDFLSSKVIVLWGNNVAETSIPDWRVVEEARRNGATIVSVDPRFTATSAGSDFWMPITPGTDVALIDAVINHVIATKAYDATYVAKYTVAPFLIDPATKKFLRSGDVGLGGDDYVVAGPNGKTARAGSVRAPQLLGTYAVGGMQAPTAMQVLADAVAQYTPEYAASITDLSVDDIKRLAGLWSGQHPVGIRLGFALSHWYRGDLTMQALLTLQALTGNIGVHGGGVTTFAGGLTTLAFDLPAWWAPEGTTMFTVMEPIDACDAMLNDKPHPLRAAWFMVDNYAQQMSDRNKVQKALRSLDFLVVSDYVMSATADLADVVLPACTYLEKTDLLSSNSFYLQYMAPAVKPLWESKSDLDQVSMVARKMGYGKYFDKTPDEYLTELMHIGDPAGADSTVTGLTWDQLKNGAPHLNMPTVPYAPFFNKEFPTKSGRIEFYVEMMIPYEQEVCGYKEQIEATRNNPLAKKYPLTFLSTHTKFRTHSQYCDLAWMNEITSDGQGFLEINPKDASSRGIADGDVVRVFNDRGEMKVHARLTQAIKPGVCNCYQGGWDTLTVHQYVEGHPNNLTHQIKNPAQSVIPNFPSNAAYYDCLVQVERA
ncbi:MAG TPA: molybdopterin-dependent oxidoreductase [Thermoleophilia bacterium]|nr:molybdopterin-dependent oxidoreductase [Thermoleophilia bacterium]